MRETPEMPERRERFIESLAAGCSRTLASRNAGVSRATSWRWERDDPEYAARCNEARLASLDLVEDALYRAAIDRLDVRAIFFILQNRAPERWADKRKLTIDLAPGVVEAEISRLERELADRPQIETSEPADNGDGR